MGCFCRRCCCINDEQDRQRPRLRNCKRQFQIAEQDQDQESKQKSVFKEIGNNNVDIDIDNVSVAVAVLVACGVLAGVLDGAELRSTPGKPSGPQVKTSEENTIWHRAPGARVPYINKSFVFNITLTLRFFCFHCFPSHSVSG